MSTKHLGTQSSDTQIAIPFPSDSPPENCNESPISIPKDNVISLEAVLQRRSKQLNDEIVDIIINHAKGLNW